MQQRENTKRRREKEDASELGCTIVDDLLSKERARLFFQNLGGSQLVMGQQTKFSFIPLAPWRCHFSPCFICQVIFLRT